MGDYPYRQLLPLLQFHCSPDEYQRIVSTYSGQYGGLIPKRGSDYWQIIPVYTYAHCPICHAQYHEQIDTYSILGWNSYLDLQHELYIEPETNYPLSQPCPHFLGLHAFLSLHDNQPTEVPDLENLTGEVPYITPWYFPDGFESYVVLHSLPICRIESNKFEPRYTVFILSYFSQDLKELRGHLLAEERAKHLTDDPEYYPATVERPGSGIHVIAGVDTNRYDESLYDLAVWAERGQLGWLDVTEVNLPLRLGVGMYLPEMYSQIKGRRWQYAWRDGQIQPRMW